MPYNAVANLVTVTKTNMIGEMPCAYGTVNVRGSPLAAVMIHV